MSLRIARVNKHIQRTFGEVLQKEADMPEDVLVTVSHVDTASNLQRTVVWLYVFPSDRADAMLALLEKQLYVLQGAINHKLTLRPLPRLVLRIDHDMPHTTPIPSSFTSS